MMEILKANVACIFFKLVIHYMHKCYSFISPIIMLSSNLKSAKPIILVTVVAATLN